MSVKVQLSHIVSYSCSNECIEYVSLVRNNTRYNTGTFLDVMIYIYSTCGKKNPGTTSKKTVKNIKLGGGDKL